MQRSLQKVFFTIFARHTYKHCNLNIYSMTNNSAHTSTHHHHHHHKDESELFKEHQLKMVHRRKIFERLLFAAACLAAVFITLAVLWLYTTE